MIIDTLKQSDRLISENEQPKEGISMPIKPLQEQNLSFSCQNYEENRDFIKKLKQAGGHSYAKRVKDQLVQERDQVLCKLEQLSMLMKENQESA